MLRSVLVPPGTGAKAAIAGYDLAGKTGTTSDFRDAWFVGYTGGFVTAVWVGKDDNTPMRHVTGGSAPAELWRAFMAAALPRLKVASIPSGRTAPAAEPDLIGDILTNTAGMSQGAGATDGGDAGDDKTQPASPPEAPGPPQ